MFKKSIFVLIVFTLFLSQASLVLAQSSNIGILPQASGSTTPGCIAPKGSGMTDATYCGNYQLNDFVALGINISRWILGIVGSLCLFMFIMGGQELLLSGGASEKIQKGKKIFVASIIGLIIVLASFLIIKASLKIVGFRWEWNGAIVNIK